VEVPVWLALNLKQRQKCRIVPPEWMDTGEINHIHCCAGTPSPLKPTLNPDDVFLSRQTRGDP